MSHEQSETIQDESGKWINVYGRNTPKAGQRLPGTPTYRTVGEAEAAARQRSEGYVMPLGPVQFDPSVSPEEQEIISQRLRGPDQFEQEIAQEKKSYGEEIAREIAEQKALNERQKAAALAAREQRKPEWEALKARQAEFEAVPQPVLQRPPTAPNTQEMLKPTSLQKTLGMASIFALLSVGLAKRNAIYGLKALGGFMEGAHAGQVEQAEAALKDYHAKMEEVHAANETALHEYNAIIGNRKMSMDMQERMFKLKALEFQDELSIQALEQGGMNAVHTRLRDLAKVNFDYTRELDRHQLILSQIAHQRALEEKAARTATAGLKQTEIAKIEDQARQEVSAALPRDQLGNIMLGPEWGKTIEDRTRKFQGLVDKRKNEIARQRGLGDIFQRDPASQEDPAMALRHAIVSGEIPKDTKAAMNFLTRRGVSPAQAAGIIQSVANEPLTEY